MSEQDQVWESTSRRRTGIARNFSGVIGFINVALTGSLAEASRQLGVSPPSLSKSIARLESQLNVRLLERSNRKMTLTAEGTHFFEECFPAVERINRIAGDLAGSAAEPAGHLRVSCSTSFGRMYIAKMLPAFSTLFPRIQIDLDLSAAGQRLFRLLPEQVAHAFENQGVRRLSHRLSGGLLMPMLLYVDASQAQCVRSPLFRTIDDFAVLAMA
jgi:DNA-binding transcriptional LysR family regulator